MIEQHYGQGRFELHATSDDDTFMRDLAAQSILGKYSYPKALVFMLNCAQAF